MVINDDEKLAREERWDSLHGVITNRKYLPAQEVISQYHGLWQVEESFRITKHGLRIRPVYHWTPQRLKAHIAICYYALPSALTEHSRQNYKVVGKKISTVPYEIK